MRDIQANEELTGAYIHLDADDPYADRKELLRRYDIECDCPRCKNPARSDARLARIATLWAFFDKHVEDGYFNVFGPRLDALIRGAVEFVNTLEAEGMQGSMKYLSAACHAVHAYVCLGDVDTAYKYASKAGVVAAKLYRVNGEQKNYVDALKDRELLGDFFWYGRGRHLRKEMQALVEGFVEVDGRN